MSKGRLIREVQLRASKEYKAAKVLYFGEWQEYQLQYIRHDGTVHHGATYYTEDRSDALDTLAHLQVKDNEQLAAA